MNKRALLNVMKDKSISLRIKEIHPIEVGKEDKLPLLYPKVSAGFPSPADDFLQEKLTLSEILILNSSTSFFVNVEGNSMKDVGIFDDDMLIVDRSAEAGDASIVVAAVNGELTVKRVERKRGKLFLMPENAAYKPIEINEETELKIWGVVTHSIHKFC